MKLRIVITALLLISGIAEAQEVLSPAGYSHGQAKASNAVQLPFFDDFSNYTGSPKATLWNCTNPLVSEDYGALPPTLGVVTLDAVDADGVLHQDAGTSAFGGDTLLSQRVRLDSVVSPIRKRLTPADSVYMSFYYLPGGGSGNMWERNGDAPEEDDSLILEFYNPTTSTWNQVWGTGGISIDTLEAQTGNAWQYVTIPIRDEAYYSDHFQFRFRNYCSLDDMSKTGLIGNSDHWHLDYIYLDYNRNHSDQRTLDVAFVEKAPSMLKEYQAMPAHQYRQSDRKDNLEMTITNLYTSPVATRYTYVIIDEDGSVVDTYDGGNDNAPCYFPNHTYQTATAHAQPAVTYQFPTNDVEKHYTIRHVVRGSVSNDNHPQNDTTTFEQVFANYYAYDDGVAENGYGLTSTSSKVKLAYEFDLNKSDTLTALDLYFNHTRDEENAEIRFYICVWEDNDGVPGNLLYKDTERRSVEFNGLNKYVRYVLEQELVVNGKIYVGIEQTSNSYINMGFDRGHDAREHIFYQTSGSWQQSILSGALMMRPYFGHKATVGIASISKEEVKAYPNPARDILHLVYGKGNHEIELFDMKGCCQYRGINTTEIDLRNMERGIYLLRVISKENMTTSTKKIIVK